MKAVVVYESMYGNTHLIANAIGDGLRSHGEVVVVSVGDVDPESIERADLVVVGGPTHAHGMSRAGTRQAAVTAAEKPGADLVVDDDAEGLGLREWFDSLERIDGKAAAFDTRVDMATAFTGRASKGIARRLHRHGATLISEPESFLVTKQNHLEPDEERRAREWGSRLSLTLEQVSKR